MSDLNLRWVILNSRITAEVSMDPQKRRKTSPVWEHFSLTAPNKVHINKLDMEYVYLTSLQVKLYLGKQIT